jgi:uncharacterized protein YaeQ
VLQRTLEGERIHRAEDIELIGMPGKLLSALEAQVERRMDWDVVVTGGQLYITSGNETHEGTFTREPLRPAV